MSVSFQQQQQNDDTEPAIEARPLELSISPEDGSLLTAPLSTVLLAATDGLYTDLYNMAEKEIEITTAQASAGSTAGGTSQETAAQQQDGGVNEEQPPTATTAPPTALAAPTAPEGDPQQQSTQPPLSMMLSQQQKKEKGKMSKINYAQRRHEFSIRLAQHGKSIAQVSALTAASLCSNVGQTTKIATTALTHARTAWLKADEAQDALFYFHAGLFPARQAPHDVLGALDVCIGSSRDGTSATENGGGGGGGRWKDLPNDLKLITDRFMSSTEHSWNKQQVTDTWHMAVRDKLVRGEVGWLRRKSLLLQQQQQQQQLEHQQQEGEGKPLHTLQVPSSLSSSGVGVFKPLWKVSLQGGIVKLTHGLPKSPVSLLNSSSSNNNNNTHNKPSTDSSSPPLDNNNKNNSSNTTATTSQMKSIYPLEANLSILSTSSKSEWTLLSVEVRAEAKTGESNHQLDTNMRQKYDLHRLCAQAMAREEARVRKLLQQQQQNDEEEEEAITKDKEKGQHTKKNGKSSETTTLLGILPQNGNTSTSTTAAAKIVILDDKRDLLVARPLERLFRVAHVFHLSWQLEILSSQAQALKKGPWSSAGLIVTPVQFNEGSSGGDEDDNDILGQLSISFWSVDDRYGPPTMADLQITTKPNQTIGERTTASGAKGGAGVMKDDVSIQSSTTATTDGKRKKQQHQFQQKVANHLTLSIRAEKQAGICVSLSGGASVISILAGDEEEQHTAHDNTTNTTTANGNKDAHQHQQYQQMSRTVEKLLDAASNPFALSASDALLAATRLSAERKCNAIVQALQPSQTQQQQQRVLPSWIYLTAEHGTITVSARIDYGQQDTSSSLSQPPLPYVVLFRLACDARTGTFVATFARTARLLQLLACNHVASSEVMAMRVAKLTQQRRKASMTAVATQHCTGRAVRDAFSGLTRSLNILGQRTGVGGPWDDIDDQAASLRQRAIYLASADVRLSLMTCCGMAAVYGLSALALGAGTGVTAAVDMAGGSVNPINDTSFLSAPPVSITLSQQMVQKTISNNTGDKKRLSVVERDLFGVTSSVNDNALTLYGLDIKVQLESPSLPEERQSCDLVPLESSQTNSFTSIGMVENRNNGDSRPQKRAKIESNGNLSLNSATTSEQQVCHLMDEVERLASVFSDVLYSSTTSD